MADQFCWVLRNPGGTGIDEVADVYEGDPHFSTEADAAEAIKALPSDTSVTWTPTRLDRPCAFVTCAECGYKLDEDEGTIVHFELAEEAFKVAAEQGWTAIDGAVWCPAEECTAAAERDQPLGSRRE